MLTRFWTGAVPSEWKLRVAGTNATSPASGDPCWTDADDAALVAACLAGRRDAFDAIVQRHSRPVYQLCYRYVGNHEDAADLAQDVFVRAFKGLNGFRGQSTLATWLYRIGINVCLNRLALQTRQTAALDPREHVDPGAERADVALLRKERATAVRAAIAQLPKKQRATLILRVYHELTHEEIAGILGGSVGAAKANFFHALANLKKLLQ